MPDVGICLSEVGNQEIILIKSAFFLIYFFLVEHKCVPKHSIGCNLRDCQKDSSYSRLFDSLGLILPSLSIVSFHSTVYMPHL